MSVIRPLGYELNALPEEAVEGAELRVCEAGCEVDYDLIKVCNYN